MLKNIFFILFHEAFVVVQWLRFHLPIRECRYDPCLESQDPTCLAAKKKNKKQKTNKQKNIKQKQCYNKFNKDFINDPHQKK